MKFEHIVIQDGGSVALKCRLAQRYPGRVKRDAAAAVELHVTMDSLDEVIFRVKLTATAASDIVTTLVSGTTDSTVCFEHTVGHLSTTAIRAHAKRDRRTARLRLVPEHVGVGA